MDNQTTQSTPTASTKPSANKPPRNFLGWKIFFWFFLVVNLLGTILLFFEVASWTTMDWIEIPSSTIFISIVGIGLYSFAYQKRFFSDKFWLGVLIVLILSTFFEILFILGTYVFHIPFFTEESPDLFASITTLVFFIPEAYILYEISHKKIEDQANTTIPTKSTPASAIAANKPPWTWWGIFWVSYLTGPAGSYLIVWQNLKRIGKPEVAKKFLIIGGVILIIELLGVILLPLPDSKSFNQSLGWLLAGIFPIWFYYAYFKNWNKDNPGVAKRFTGSILGWGFLGTAIWLVIAVVFILIVDSIWPGRVPPQ